MKKWARAHEHDEDDYVSGTARASEQLRLLVGGLWSEREARTVEFGARQFLICCVLDSRLTDLQTAVLQKRDVMLIQLSLAIVKCGAG